MSDPLIIAALIAAIGAVIGAVLAFRSTNRTTLVTGQSAFIDDLREELERHKRDSDDERRLLLSQLAEARAEVAQFKAEAAARTAGDICVDTAIPPEHP